MARRHGPPTLRTAKGGSIMKALLKRPLGTSDLQITQVGFGAWAIGGGGWAYGWGSQDDADSIAAIRHAVNRGINWIDTAAIYGLGHSEEVVGRALREIPAVERPYVFTKGGMVPDPSRPFEEPQRNLRPESIRKEVEASLRRLGVERIDLYQFHWPDGLGTPVEESWGEMSRLIREGKVRVGGAWTLSWPGVSGAIVGARSPSQVDGWLAAGNLTLEKEDLSEIADAVKRTQAGEGPARPWTSYERRRRAAG